MSETKTTAWRWIEGDQPTHAELIRADCEVGDSDSILYHGADWPMSEATKRMIAAAPALAEALEACITDDSAHCMVDESRNAAHKLRRRLDEITRLARAALAAAKGER